MSVCLSNLTGCSLLATRPSQEMSDATAAIHAAKEVQADVLAPEIYRLAREAYIRARREYRFQNYARAAEELQRTRELSERAEFDALRAGGDRTPTPPADPLMNVPLVKEEDLPPEAEEPLPGKDSASPDSGKGVTLETFQEMKRAEQNQPAPAPSP